MSNLSSSDRRKGSVWTILLTIILFLLLLTWPPDDAPDSPSSFTQEARITVSFSENVRVTDGSSSYPHQVEPSIVVDSDGTILVGWKEALAPDGPGRRVGFSRSEDGGFTWSPNLLMARRASNRFQSDPWLAVDETDRVYYARLEFETTVNGVVVTHSDDGGVSWSVPREVDDQPGFADKESIATDGSTIYLAYDDVPPIDGNISVRFSRSLDGGESWSPTIALGDGAQAPGAPVIAAGTNGAVYVAGWDTQNILAARSGDRGVTWADLTRVNLVDGSAADDESHIWWLSLPSIATDSQGRVYIAWADWGTGDMDVLVSRSDDGGVTWSMPVRINDDSSGLEQRMVSLAVDPTDRLHAAWYDNRTGNLNVFYSSSSDGGETWSSNMKVTSVETSSEFQRPGDYLGLAADSEGNVYVVWTDGRGADFDIYFAFLDRESPVVDILSPTEGESLFSPQQGVNGTASDNVGVALVELSTDNGTTWVNADGTELWSATLDIPLGENVIMARAIDTSGNQEVDSVTVTLTPPEESLPPPIEPILLFVLPAVVASVAGVSVWLLWKRRRSER